MRSVNHEINNRLDYRIAYGIEKRIEERYHLRYNNAYRLLYNRIDPGSLARKIGFLINLIELPVETRRFKI